MNMINKEIIDFANYLADISEEIAIKYFRVPNGEIVKEDFSPVTQADQEIEALLRIEIAAKYPNHGIIGEEYDAINPDADYQWIIDPIDGTSSFIIGRPTFGTLIALCYKGESKVGIINQPITKERWLGVDGQGAWLNGKPIKSRKCNEIKDAIISTTSDFFFAPDDLVKFKEVATQAKYQRFGGVVYGADCYGYALLASGFLDIIIEPELKIFDFAALIPIIKMAGGAIGKWDGSPLELKSNVKLIACGDKELFKKVVAVMK